MNEILGIIKLEIVVLIMFLRCENEGDFGWILWLVKFIFVRLKIKIIFM